MNKDEIEFEILKLRLDALEVQMNYVTGVLLLHQRYYIKQMEKEEFEEAKKNSEEKLMQPDPVVSDLGLDEDQE